MADLLSRVGHYLITASLLFTQRLHKSEGQMIRLVGPGSSRCSGRVEVYHNGRWGTVCDGNWDMDDAAVICRQLHCGTAVKALDKAQFGEGTGPIWLDRVSCSGRESSLMQCQHDGFGPHFCQHDEDASAVCSAVLPKPSITMTPVVGIMLGQNVIVACSITGLSGGAFVLRRFDQDVQTADSNPASFHLGHISFDHDGYYVCVYQEDFSDQTLISPPSDSVRIQVIVPFLLVLFPSAVGLLLVLGCVVACCVSKRRSAAERSHSMHRSSNKPEDENDYCELQRVDSGVYEEIGSSRSGKELH